MIRLNDELEKVSSVAITGHVRPDGDCVGSTFGIYNYIKDNFPGVQADVYLEKPGDEYGYIPHVEEIVCLYDGQKEYELLIVCDCGAVNRFEPFAALTEKCKRIICYDHHVGNSGFADECFVIEDYSSTCELVYDAMDEEMISVRTATCLFTGLVTDTGSFKYQATTPKTHLVAARLMEKGVNYTFIMDACLSTRTIAQNKVIGKALITSRMLCGGKVVLSYFTYDQMQEYHVIGRDMGVVIDQLRSTAGTEVAVFLYALGPNEYKVSMRARDYIDVSAICRLHGGGGHVKASGCTMHGNVEEIIREITENLEAQFREKQNV